MDYPKTLEWTKQLHHRRHPLQVSSKWILTSRYGFYPLAAKHPALSQAQGYNARYRASLSSQPTDASPNVFSSSLSSLSSVSYNSSLSESKKFKSITSCCSHFRWLRMLQRTMVKVCVLKHISGDAGDPYHDSS